MTPTAEWYEADADDSDRNVTDDITASTPQEPRGAILPIVEPVRGFSDADLLRRRTAALNRTSAENERLRAEVERLRSDKAWYTRWTDRWIADMELMETRVARAEDGADAAEAKLRDVEALADEWLTKANTANSTANARLGLSDQPALRQFADVMWRRVDELLALLARSQAPQAPAEQEPPADAHTPEERILRDILTNQPE